MNKQKIRLDLVNYVWEDATFKARLYNDFGQKSLKEWRDDQSRFIKENIILTPVETQYLLNKITKIREAVDAKHKCNEIFLCPIYKSPIPHCIVEWIEFCNLVDVKFLAEGGYGKVYSAMWTPGKITSWNETRNAFVRKSKMVALKVFNGDDFPEDELFQEAKWNQVFTGKRTVRPFVVNILGFTRNQEGKYMIVLDLCGGGDLRDYLQKHYKTMSWKDKIKVTWDISHDIQNIVENGSIHGDLHPGNILLLNCYMNNDWLISDLGTCESVNESEKQEKEIMGVLPYMAPELLCGSRKTQESDIYSFGMIMWTISAGCVPFNDRYGDPYLVNDIICGLRPPIIPGTPKKYADLMLKCWAKNPHDRIFANDAVQILRELLRDIIENKFIEEYSIEKNQSWNPPNLGFTVFRTSERLIISNLINPIKELHLNSNKLILFSEIHNM
ncbi:28299_t:CDS:2 [Gigaspora margarita]|uniref:28299_t:CDS:1 n=1 Tax=Gigaspora margarita TaxID=4874 RepID=A0ABN7UVC9_GIGMA|nr:28299_t:CDS:2 [Gigaspora margarita]